MENRAEYVTLVEKYRLSEFDTQVQAIKKGLGTILPINLLPLFTWAELETMVCGKREISVEYLKANTRYRQPFSENNKLIQWFWETFESFSHEVCFVFFVLRCSCCCC
jgi:E3 ubiquitin-protein ligase HECTD4